MMNCDDKVLEAYSYSNCIRLTTMCFSRNENIFLYEILTTITYFFGLQYQVQIRNENYKFEAFASNFLSFA